MKKLFLTITLLFSVFGISQPITVSSTNHTVTQLVNDVLINSPCVSGSNITWRTGTNFGSSNGIGYFQNTNPNFPMQSGVILSTGNAVNAAGTNTSMLNDGTNAWTGDTDLEATLAAAGIPMTSANATVLEFDFTPISPNFSFDFIFASEEYGNFQCQYSDAFAFLLTNLNTGVTTNLAVVPNTDDPISVVTIRDFLYNSSCPSVNSEYFGRFNGGSNIATSAINFNGQTKVLTASSVLTTGVPYHIKLVIADRLDYKSDSAIFISSNSFNIGQDVLGADLTVANNTALCNGSTYTIDTQLDPNLYSFVWKNGTNVITGENGPTLTVNTAGTYSVTFQNSFGECSAITNDITIEFSSQLSVLNPVNLYRCDSGASNFTYNLDSNTARLKTGLNANTVVTYHASLSDANSTSNALPLQYTSAPNTTIYARVEVPGGCFVVKAFTLLTAAPSIANQPQNLTSCENTFGGGVANFNFYSLRNEILGTQSSSLYDVFFYASQANADNNNNSLNSISYTSGNATIYVRVQNKSDITCYSTTSFNIIVSPLPVVDDLQDVTVCTEYILPVITNGNYFTASNGGGTPLFAGDAITQTQTIFIYNQAGGSNSCSAGSSFQVTIIDIDDFAPSDVFNCGNYTLPTLPQGGKYYTQPGGNGTVINPGTVITTTRTIYFYYQTTIQPVCTVDTSFEVTILPKIHVGRAPDVFECTSYTLPPLSVGNYYTQAYGNGTILQPGTVITQNTTLFIYASTGGEHPCTDMDTIKIFIGINQPADINQCNGYTLPNLPIGKYYTGAMGTGQEIPSGTLIDYNTTIYIYQPTTSGLNNCTDNLSFNLTFSAPPIDTLPSVSSCVSYILPTITNGEYFTGVDGTGTMLSAGDEITSTQTIYIFKRLNAACANQSSFTVTIHPLPAIDSRADIDICNQYVLTPLTVGNYYTGPNGTGNLLTGGTVITSTQKIYIYAISNTTPACSIENSFQLNIFSTVADNPDDVTACDSYTLPTLSEDNHYYTATGGPNGIGVELLPGTQITTTQTIYVFKEALIRTDFSCSAENSFVVTVNHTPVIAPISNINVCNSFELPVLTVGNYFTGMNGTGTMLPAGTSITSPQTIYVYGETATSPNCSSQRSFNVNVFNVDEIPSTTICESYTLPTLSVGKYYTGQNGTGTQLLAGQTLSTSQTIYIYQQSPFSPTCNDESSFDITIVDTPIANNVALASRTVCDEDGTNDGITNFDLTTLNAEILGTQTGSEFTVQYFKNNSDALTQNNPITSTDLASVFVRVNNTLAPNCFDIKPITIIVNKLPQPTALDGFVCIDNETGQLLKSYTMYSGLSATKHTFEWKNDADVIVGTGTAYTTNVPGIFTLTVKNTTTGCTSEVLEIEVKQSEPATVTYVVEDDFSANQNIIVTATGLGGNYEYQLDNGQFQDSNIFENVTSGIHTITVRDKNECGTTTIQAIVLNYPKYFTPNGDGYNDTWNIRDLKNQPSAVIMIFDRYGKFLKQLRPNGEGWDGTYNGKQLHADDYWFTVSYTDENQQIREFKSHFAMKR
jgi:gliding motility-associated-like protein